MVQNLNILLSTFPGLGLPPTTTISLPPDATYTDLCDHVRDILPPNFNSRILLSTPGNKHISPSELLLSSLTEDETNLIAVRLSVPLCGGKGGFGSQLRAAGGRMSSRKKRAAGEQNGSNRNLDGRRLRTITEAKNLAEYLAVKPEMDAKAKDERKKRWQAVIDAAERKEDEIKRGARGKGLSDEFLDDKEDAAERAREAVRKAMATGNWKDGLGSSDLVGGSASSSGEGGSASPSEEDSDVDDSGAEDEEEIPATSSAPKQRHFAGFDDEDDEYMSDSEDEAVEEADSKGKGKGKA